jgi:hypothetical protein
LRIRSAVVSTAKGETPVDVDGFWEIVESARARSGGNWNGVPSGVVESLAALPLAEIADFAQIQDGLEWQAYREDVWAACMLLNGGHGSVDGFLYFRDWMLVQGREAFEAALADPDSLADVPAAREIAADQDNIPDCEHFVYVADEAWEQVTGEQEGLYDELDERGFEAHRDVEHEVAGEPIDFDDRQQVSAVLPKLSAVFYDRAAANRATWSDSSSGMA